MSFFFIPISSTRPRPLPSLIWTVPSLFIHSSGVICQKRKLIQVLHHLETYNPGVLTSMVPMVSKSGIQIKSLQKPMTVLHTWSNEECPDGRLSWVNWVG